MWNGALLSVYSALKGSVCQVENKLKNEQITFTGENNKV